MIEKSKGTKVRQEAEEITDSFRKSVLDAQQSAKDAGVPYTIVVDNQRFNVMPNGDKIPVAPASEDL